MKQSCDRVGARSAAFGVLVSLKRRVRAQRGQNPLVYILIVSVFSVHLHKIYIVYNKGELEKRFPVLGNNLLHQHMCADCGSGCDMFCKNYIFIPVYRTRQTYLYLDMDIFLCTTLGVPILPVKNNCRFSLLLKE
jgi:hypothetical protein